MQLRFHVLMEQVDHQPFLRRRQTEAGAAREESGESMLRQQRRQINSHTFFAASASEFNCFRKRRGCRMKRNDFYTAHTCSRKQLKTLCIHALIGVVWCIGADELQHFGNN